MAPAKDFVVLHITCSVYHSVVLTRDPGVSGGQGVVVKRINVV